MSNGFIYNNPSNIHVGNNGYGSSNPWEGVAQATYTDAGNQALSFQDVVFGLRATMQLIYNKLYNDHYNLYQLVTNWTGLTNDSDILAYMQIINQYFNTDLDIDSSASPIDPTNDNVLNLAKGIVQNEIPEYNQITSSQWQQAYNYYLGKSYSYTATNDNRPLVNTNPSNQIAGLNIWIILAIVGGALFIFNKKR